jgi:hypothetical protein
MSSTAAGEALDHTGRCTRRCAGGTRHSAWDSTGRSTGAALGLALGTALRSMGAPLGDALGTTLGKHRSHWAKTPGAALEQHWEMLGPPLGWHRALSDAPSTTGDESVQPWAMSLTVAREARDTGRCTRRCAGVAPGTALGTGEALSYTRAGAFGWHQSSYGLTRRSSR